LFAVPPFNQIGVFVLYNNGDGTFTNWQNLAAGEQPYMFAVAPIDGNNFQDIYIVDDQQDFYHLVDGSTPDQSVSYSTLNSTDPRTAAFGGNCKFADLDGDGDLDFGIADVDVDIPPCNSGASMRKFSLMQNDQGVLDPSYGSVMYPWNVSTYDFVFLDANGDFLMDFLLGVCDGYQLFLQVPECSAAFALTPQYEACEGDVVTIDAGPGFDLYDWSNGETTQSIDVLTGATYCVTVTDVDGCTYSSCTDVIYLPQPMAQILGDTAICPGGSTILEAVGNGTFMWSDGSTEPFLDVFVAGQYCVTVTDVSGCTNTACVEVIEVPNPVPVIHAPQGLCPGGETTLYLQETYAEVSWSTGETTETIVVTSAGQYCVTVLDFDGCVGIDCLELLEAMPPVVDLGDTVEHCAGTTALLDAGIPPDPSSYQYLWSHGEVGPSVNVTGNFTYCVTVIDANGCTAEDCVEVIEIPVDSLVIIGPSHICRGETLTVMASGGFASYLWSGGDTSSMLTITEGGEYCVTAIDANGCAATQCLTITESEAVVPDFGFDTLVICSGDAYQIVLNGATYATYLWSNGSTAPSITVDFPGTLCVTVTDTLGCQGSSCITIIQLPENVLVIDAIVCHGDSINPDSLGAGVFTGANGCDSIVEVGIMELPQIMIDNLVITPDPGSGSGGISLEGVSVPGGISYQWSTGDTTASISGLFRGTYVVTITDAFGCTGVFTFSVPLGTTRPDLDPGDIITVHPNPFRSNFTLFHPRLTGVPGEILIIDLTGRQITRQGLQASGKTEVELEAPPGVYLGFLIHDGFLIGTVRLIHLD
ncbi:MAG: T9SS type A sorting domain-containing protein, partial [Saprospiraceae bacterium]|nr:T9SS type A sorting domain-containing protein [Saprospiraceae bacterium]